MTEVHESFAKVVDGFNDCQRTLQYLKDYEENLGCEMSMKFIIVVLIRQQAALVDAIQQWANCGFPIQKTDTGIFELVKED